MIHLIVGNTGSGKTTYCNQLKAQNKGVIFSIDSWNKTLFLPDKKETDGLKWFLQRIDRAEAMIQNLILQLDNAGRDAILDLGLSKFSHREKFRKFALENNSASVILNVNRFNKALSFYERMGFKVIDEVNIEIGNGYLMEDYVMEKTI